ncbi:MAG: 30S ribosomal protein S20 [Parcubacteria group bacterium CG23_combo_of_CG06-09_8_20_14_all_35_9]|nr:MAG: 30S ribosomal protein S20 [Parcubacteria group bacterium CG23_combo_of_CG06-09_8_20_14_all_35_9]
MSIKKSAKKALRQSKKRALRNKKIKDDLKTLIKLARRAIETKEKDKAKEAVAKATRAIDRAAQKGVIKKNNAARKKSALMKKLNALKVK